MNNLENDAIKVLGAQILFCALACPNSIVTINKKLKNYFEVNFEISSEYEISNSLLNETKALLDGIPNFELEKSSKEKFNNLLTSFCFKSERIYASPLRIKTLFSSQYFKPCSITGSDKANFFDKSSGDTSILCLHKYEQ